MLLGMPVVSSDAGGVRSMLDSGREGILYRRNETGALAQAVCELLNPANEERTLAMARAARERARRTHDADANYRRLLEIYHEINLCV